MGIGLRTPSSATRLSIGECWQPANEYVVPALENLRTKVSATDPQSQQFRSLVGLLQDSPDSVYTITDDGTCHRASVALRQFKGITDTLSVYPVLVIKAGRERYVLDDGVSQGGEYAASYVADTSFNIMGAMVN